MLSAKHITWKYDKILYRLKVISYHHFSHIEMQDLTDRV
jgi:hypothetical protein